jgi:UPF0716 protein FxsA
MRFFVFFALVALAEMATFLWVGSHIGLGWALGLALATALIGSVLVRRAGLAVLGQIRRRWREGSLPGREATHGASILVAGAFLISPGFITDTLGFLLLIPAVRDQIHDFVSRWLSGRVAVIASKRPPRWEEPAQGEVIDVDGWEEDH